MIPIGAHLVTPRDGYRHHGIYVGEGKVVHYAGYCGALRGGPVEEVSLEQFAAGVEVWVEPALRARYSGAEIAQRARTRLGERRYRLLTNNCEHFCAWCVRGESRSAQVETCLTCPHRGLCMLARLCRAVLAGRFTRRIPGSVAAC